MGIDIGYSKINRFVKEPGENKRLFEMLLKYMHDLKDAFHYCAALSTFPSIGWLDFVANCNMWKLPDTKTLNMNTIDRLFIVTNVEVGEEHEDNPDRDLCRYEFYEVIVRMGGAKYKDSGKCRTWEDAVEMIMQKNIIPNTV